MQAANGDRERGWWAMNDRNNSELENGGSQGISVVQVSIPNQPVQVQSVIQSNPAVLQTGTGHNVQTIQVVRVAAVEDELSDDSEGRKRREILSRRPSYRKILNELSSPVSISKIDEESNSSQSQDGESQEAATNLTTSGIQYQSANILPAGAIQLSNHDQQSLQTLTMSNASPAQVAATAAGATIVQYAQGPDGQFYIPVSVGGTGTMQAYQLATGGSIPQGVVMATTGSPITSPQQLSEEAARKRELRLLKNREAASDCRRKKKDYIKCLENRVAVLENQNKTLIEELKGLKELYCQQDG